MGVPEVRSADARAGDERPLEFKFWAATDVGLTRDHNEDNFLVDKKLNLFIVADGMGGHAAGEVASSVAVREVRRIIVEAREVVEAYNQKDTPAGRQAVLDLIDQAIRGACARVFEMAQESPDRRGMGTTLSMMLLAGRRGFIGHVGDSRVYLTRADQVHQLTEDHSLINELIKRGRLKPGDHFDSPYKNAVTRAVGVYETVEVDTFDFDALPGDNYLLCSDGLSGYLDDETTHTYMAMAEVKEVPERFIRFANDCGGKDNITAVVVRVLDAVEDEQRKRANDVRQRLSTLRSVPLLRYLDYKGLVKVHNLVELEPHDTGSVVFQEGERQDAMYVVLSGRVRLMLRGNLLLEVGPGGHFGEMALVDKGPRDVSALVAEPTRLLVLRRARVYEAMSRDNRLALKLMWSMVQLVNRRYQLTRGELGNAWDTVDRMRRFPDAVVDLPSLDPGLAGIGSLPIDLTDELVPGFLFVESEAGTDPFIRRDVSFDPDERPGLAPARPDGSAPGASRAALPPLPAEINGLVNANASTPPPEAVPPMARAVRTPTPAMPLSSVAGAASPRATLIDPESSQALRAALSAAQGSDDADEDEG